MAMVKGSRRKFAMNINLYCPGCNEHRMFDFQEISEFTQAEMTDGKSAECPYCKTKAIIRTSGMPMHAAMPKGHPLYLFVLS